MNLLERVILVAFYPLAKAIEFVGGAIDDINWNMEHRDE